MADEKSNQPDQGQSSQSSQGNKPQEATTTPVKTDTGTEGAKEDEGQETTEGEDYKRNL